MVLIIWTKKVKPFLRRRGETEVENLLLRFKPGVTFGGEKATCLLCIFLHRCHLLWKHGHSHDGANAAYLDDGDDVRWEMAARYSPALSPSLACHAPHAAVSTTPVPSEAVSVCASVSHFTNSVIEPCLIPLFVCIYVRTNHSLLICTSPSFVFHHFFSLLQTVKVSQWQ